MLKRSILVLLCILILGPAGSAFAGLDPSLAAWWPFDEGEGTVAYDATGNGNDGVFVGDPQWVPGVLGSALEFNGDDYLNCGDGPTLQIQDAITMAFWFNVEAFVNTWEGFLAKGDDSYRASRGDGSGNATHMGISGTSTGGGNGYFNGTVLITGGDWHHYAATYDGAEGRIYIDGVLDVTSEGTGQINISGYDLYIGENAQATGRFLHGILDDIQIYNRALSEAEVNSIMKGLADQSIAQNPTPLDEAVDIPRDVVLGWDAGETAATHDVYFGTTFDDVNDGPGTLVSQGQTATTYDPDGLLAFGQTYYWRIDEVNAAPDNTIFKGTVWSFTAEPFAYPVQDVVATSNGSSDAGVGPERTVDGSGLSAADEHSTAAGDMWLAVPGAEPLSVLYEFDGVYKLHEMLVWNYNVQFEPMLGFGLKDVTVEYSENGTDWMVLGDVQFAQATARTDYVANTAIDFGGAAVKYVRLTVNSGYGPLGQFGLSEVRFLYIPASAREPQPDVGDTNVAAGTALSWRAGREAVTHDVYLGTDPNALALADSVSEASYVPGNLEFGSTYYWKIDEVNEADEISVWAGALWDFVTQEYAVIDDMESYTDDIDAGEAIFQTWIDGWDNGTGSTVGYLQAPFAEQTIVNSGSQSMPLTYDNSVAPFYSEAEKDLGSLSLTGNGADTLRLFVSGLAPGFFESADGTILMNGIGTDIWDTADQFRFAYKSLTGNGSMIARVDSLDTSTDVWVKAGVMIRQGTGTGSQHSFMPITGSGGNGASWQGRVSEGLASVNQDQDAASPVAAPYWVRIDRAGNSLTGFISADGQTWTQLGDPREVVMTDPVLIGLALTSHNANQATSAQFSNVSFTGSVTGAWQIAEIGVAQPAGNTPQPIYVAVEDSSGKVAVVSHPDEAASARSGWTEWLIPYSDLGGVNLNSISTIYVGVGDRDNPSSGGAGTIFIDDIGFGRPVPVVESAAE